jgi:hypothetical protein
MKHNLASTIFNNETINWECYDPKGNMICKNGDGRWITYDDSCKNIQLEGQVKGGYMEGDWNGHAVVPDTIKYTYHYRHSLLQSSVGYSKNGKAHPFVNEYEIATYRSGPLTFLEILRGRIKIPRNTNGAKMSIDTIHVSFIVERDGKLTHFGINGNVDTQLKEAVFNALEKSNQWVPSKIYGIPFRTQITLPLNETSGYEDNYSGKQYGGSYYQKGMIYQERIIKDN